MSAAGRPSLAGALAAARAAGHPALAAYLTAGYPSRSVFEDALARIASVADVVEIGVPFTDPMADGVTIQRASRRALEHGVRLEWILETVRAQAARLEAPIVLMSYLNPLLAVGLERLANALADAGIEGCIVPDLPLEESAPLAEALEARGLALIRLVSPVTPPDRLARIAAASRGFVYAVTMMGTTGGRSGIPATTGAYLDRVRALSPVPVLAGFGVRSKRDVDALARHVDGVIVGSALIEALDRGEDPAQFLGSLRNESRVGSEGSD